MGEVSCSLSAACGGWGAAGCCEGAACGTVASGKGPQA
eukprot:CAMPEP_0113300382 /NCGR_PEP_ID=MMETSP0010_2-20120614/2041_1 /TAXON_ID=216773 ORGANISM="Corethron hystrix, Strain 308" /NCGR_SAMPLE_ID=MMETSP0010_2 /ASSEMBLY_ACC=CAM_ASM_000155 /LENGTH=37 /DNA_ID=CAMNT_0000153809 /DNA_START=416 /DNA_END=526 /DNA_ORIENTATION=- /assembly_acc=CAM_ASM_000155